MGDGQEIRTGGEEAVRLLQGPPVLCSPGPLRAASTLPFFQTPVKGLSRSRCSLRGTGKKHATHSLLSQGWVPQALLGKSLQPHLGTVGDGGSGPWLSSFLSLARLLASPRP